MNSKVYKLITFYSRFFNEEDVHKIESEYSTTEGKILMLDYHFCPRNIVLIEPKYKLTITPFSGKCEDGLQALVDRKVYILKDDSYKLLQIEEGQRREIIATNALTKYLQTMVNNLE